MCSSPPWMGGHQSAIFTIKTIVGTQMGCPSLQGQESTYLMNFGAFVEMHAPGKEEVILSQSWRTKRVEHPYEMVMMAFACIVSRSRTSTSRAAST